MSTWFWITTIVFIVVSAGMVLIILVQRPQGGGLAGAFGGAGGAGTETVFGGRVGDALTWATVIAFAVYLSLAVGLNLLDDIEPAAATTRPAAAVTTPPASTPPAEPTTGQPSDSGQTIELGDVEPGSTPVGESEPSPIPATHPADEPDP